MVNHNELHLPGGIIIFPTHVGMNRFTSIAIHCLLLLMVRVSFGSPWVFLTLLIISKELPDG